MHSRIATQADSALEFGICYKFDTNMAIWVSQQPTGKQTYIEKLIKTYHLKVFDNEMLDSNLNLFEKSVSKGHHWHTFENRHD